MAGIQGPKKPFCLGNSDFCGLAIKDAVSRAAHGGEGIQNDGMSFHEHVKKMPQGSQSLVPRGSGAFQPGDIVACHSRSDPMQLVAMVLTPGEKTSHDPSVSPLGVFVAQCGLEELLGRKHRVRTSALQ